MSNTDGYELILQSLNIVLHEMRISEDLNFVHLFADAFRNIPSMVARRAPPSEMMDDVLTTAGRYDHREYMVKYITDIARMNNLSTNLLK